jgi:hypothetical protein
MTRRSSARARAEASEREAADGRSREAVHIRTIVVEAARAGRGDVWRILAVAVAVSLVTVVVEIITDHFADPANELSSLAGNLSAQGVSLLGTVLLSGFLTQLVGHAQYAGPAQPGGTAQPGGERVTIGRVVRTLPWIRLIVGDILVTVLFVAGLIALVIPGLVLLNLLAVVGPVIEIERRSVFAALRRSAHLVRRHFWTVALLATVPVLVVGEIESLLPDPHGVPAILEVLAVRGVAIAVVEAAIGLVLVRLCFRLIDLDAQASAAEPSAAEPSAAEPSAAEPSAAPPGAATSQAADGNG